MAGVARNGVGGCWLVMGCALMGLESYAGGNCQNRREGVWALEG